MMIIIDVYVQKYTWPKNIRSICVRFWLIPIMSEVFVSYSQHERNLMNFFFINQFTFISVICYVFVLSIVYHYRWIRRTICANEIDTFFFSVLIAFFSKHRLHCNAYLFMVRWNLVNRIIIFCAIQPMDWPSTGAKQRPQQRCHSSLVRDTTSHFWSINPAWAAMLPAKFTKSTIKWCTSWIIWKIVSAFTSAPFKIWTLALAKGNLYLQIFCLLKNCNNWNIYYNLLLFIYYLQMFSIKKKLDLVFQSGAMQRILAG